MSSTLDAPKKAKTILLTTYKRDGAPVATLVSIAFDGDRAFFRSYDKAWKTKRLRNNPSVDVAPATLRGKPTGPTVHARAALLAGGQAELARNALARRHRALQAILVPLAHRLMRYRTMHYELQAEDQCPPVLAGCRAAVWRAVVSQWRHQRQPGTGVVSRRSTSRCRTEFA